MSFPMPASAMQPTRRHRSSALVQALLGAVSPGGSSGPSILIYHRVLAAADPLFPDAVDVNVFSRHLAILRATCHVIALEDAVRLARAGQLPPRTACITFDDGYADNATQALPLLRQHGLCATFFVATGFLDGGRMWNDTIIELVRAERAAHFDARAVGLGQLPLADMAQRRVAIGALLGQLKYRPMDERLALVETLRCQADCVLPGQLMMRGDQVRQLHAAGMGIGAHTVNHPILSTIPISQAGREIADGKLALEKLLGAPVQLFAYPNGKPNLDYQAAHVALVRELGFEGAVSTAWGGRNRDLYQLPRFTPWDQARLPFQLRLAWNCLHRAERA